jgi:hypothetical protein
MAETHETVEQIELDIDLEDIAANVDIAADELFAHYVVYPLRFASHGQFFLSLVIDTITSSSTISPTAWYAADFKPPRAFEHIKTSVHQQNLQQLVADEQNTLLASTPPDNMEGTSSSLHKEMDNMDEDLLFEFSHVQH